MDHHTDSNFSPPDDGMLERYLARQATPGEAAQVHAWLTADERARGRVESLGHVLSSPERNSAHNTADWADRILRDDAARRARRGQQFGAISRTARFALGAGLAVAAVFALAISQRGGLSTSPPLARQYVTVAGQRAEVSLPGGHVVVLGPASAISVTAAMGEKAEYAVSLTGQALFTVAHRAGTPFVVRTARTETQVLGTSFDIREYDDDSVTQVTVLEGRVSVQPAIVNVVGQGPRPLPQQLSQQLAANMQALVDDSGRVRARTGVNTTDYVGWSQGMLVFRAATASAVVAELSRAYGVTIRVTDTTLVKQRVDWYVETEKYPLSQVLHELSVMLEAHPVRSGDVVTMVPGRRAVRRPQVTLPSSEVRYGR